MKVKKVEKLYLAGLSVRTNNKNEFSQDEAKIGQLWQDYSDSNYEGKIFNKSNGMAMYGVYHDYESNESADYTVTVGVEVTKPKNAIKIENQRYLVFTKKGEIPDVVIELWTQIWEYFNTNTEYTRAYKVDFEKYAKEDEIEIYISIL
jgi:predicted transcriptional regulator YdeE